MQRTVLQGLVAGLESADPSGSLAALPGTVPVIPPSLWQPHMSQVHHQNPLFLAMHNDAQLGIDPSRALLL